VASARNRLLARIARRGGAKLLDLAVANVFPTKDEKIQGAPAGEPGAPAEPKPEAKPKPSLTRGLAGTAIARIATRSVPGAIVVGGGILAKALYDRRRSRRGRGKGRNGRA
jgi:hypothetical protein